MAVSLNGLIMLISYFSKFNHTGRLIAALNLVDASHFAATPPIVCLHCLDSVGPNNHTHTHTTVVEAGTQGGQCVAAVGPSG